MNGLKHSTNALRSPRDTPRRSKLVKREEPKEPPLCVRFVWGHYTSPLTGRSSGTKPKVSNEPWDNSTRAVRSPTRKRSIPESLPSSARDSDDFTRNERPASQPDLGKEPRLSAGERAHVSTHVSTSTLSTRPSIVPPIKLHLLRPAEDPEDMPPPSTARASTPRIPHSGRPNSRSSLGRTSPTGDRRAKDVQVAYHGVFSPRDGLLSDRTPLAGNGGHAPRTPPRASLSSTFKSPSADDLKMAVPQRSAAVGVKVTKSRVTSISEVGVTRDSDGHGLYEKAQPSLAAWRARRMPKSPQLDRRSASFEQNLPKTTRAATDSTPISRVDTSARSSRATSVTPRRTTIPINTIHREESHDSICAYTLSMVGRREVPKRDISATRAIHKAALSELVEILTPRLSHVSPNYTKHPSAAKEEVSEFAGWGDSPPRDKPRGSMVWGDWAVRLGEDSPEATSHRNGQDDVVDEESKVVYEEGGIVVHLPGHSVSVQDTFNAMELQYHNYNNEGFEGDPSMNPLADPYKLKLSPADKPDAFAALPALLQPSESATLNEFLPVVLTSMDVKEREGVPQGYFRAFLYNEGNGEGQPAAQQQRTSPPPITPNEISASILKMEDIDEEPQPNPYPPPKARVTFSEGGDSIIEVERLNGHSEDEEEEREVEASEPEDPPVPSRQYPVAQRPSCHLKPTKAAAKKVYVANNAKNFSVGKLYEF